MGNSADVHNYNAGGNDEELAEQEKQLLATIEKLENDDPLLVHLNVNNSVYAVGRPRVGAGVGETSSMPRAAVGLLGAPRHGTARHGRHLTEALQVRIGNALAKNTHLIELLMANSVIKETGAIAIGKGLQSNSSITVVNLESNRSVVWSTGGQPASRSRRSV